MTKREMKRAINIVAHVIGVIAMTIALVFAVIVVAFICDGNRLEIVEAMIMAESAIISATMVLATIVIHRVKKTFYRLVDKSEKLVDLD